MACYGARTLKPTICFGTTFSPQLCCIPLPRIYRLGHARPWLDKLKAKLSQKDRARMKKAKENKDKAMVIKTVNKRGKTSV